MPPKPKKKNGVSEVARRIEELRNSRGESQTAFAAIVRTKPSAISKWEAGNNRPTPDAFVRIARVAEGSDKEFFLDQAGVKEGKRTDPKLLAEVLEAVEAEMKRVGGGFSNQIRAEIISGVYDSWRETGKRDCSIVEKIVSEVRCPSNQRASKL